MIAGFVHSKENVMFNKGIIKHNLSLIQLTPQLKSMAALNLELKF